jgi:uncharacterized membrane protein
MKGTDARSQIDWLLLIVYCLVCIGLFLVFPHEIYLAALAVPIVAFIPGYSLLTFSHRFRSLDFWECLVFSVVISAALTIMTYMAIGTWLGKDQLLASLTVLTMIALALSIVAWQMTIKGSGSQLRNEMWRAGGWFRKLPRRSQALMSLAMVGILVVASFSVVVLSIDTAEKYSEFYVLNESGQAYDLPSKFLPGEVQNVTLGIANHEKRDVVYYIEIWEVNYTNINYAVSVNEMYYCGSFNVTLQSKDVDLNGQYTPQFETNVGLNLTFKGNMSLFFMMFKDAADPLPEYPLDPTKNYAFDPLVSWRIVECVNKEVEYLKLKVQVNERETKMKITGDGGALPHDFHVGVAQNVTVNLTNAEGRKVDYSLEMWMVNYTNIGMAVTVTQMYYLGCINITLNDSRTNLASSYQQVVPLNLMIAGNMSVMFILFKGAADPLPEYPLVQGKNYAFTSASDRILLCANHQVQYFELETIVSA